MLQQTVIKAVIPAYARFLETFPTVRDLATANEDEVRPASRGLGYYRRFELLHKAAKELSQQEGEIVYPKTFKGWKEHLESEIIPQPPSAASASISRPR